MFNNYYYYKNGNRTVSTKYFDKATALMIAALAAQNDSIDHILTVDATTGEIVGESWKALFFLCYYSFY